MNTVHIGDKKVNIQASMYTAVVYEQEFKADMIKNIASPLWIDSFRALWAMAYTYASIHDEQFPHFNEWIKEATGGINLEEVSAALEQEYALGFFHSTTPKDTDKER